RTGSRSLDQSRPVGRSHGADLAAAASCRPGRLTSQRGPFGRYGARSRARAGGVPPTGPACEAQSWPRADARKRQAERDVSPKRGWPPRGPTMGTRMDVLFRGATVYDGSGAAGVQRDVVVRGERIVVVGAESAQMSGGRVVNAGGLALAPGFIDLHSHADHTLPAFPRATNSVTQGVTTELVGLCGFSAAPVSADPLRRTQLQDLASGIGPDLDWSWQTFAEYVERFEAAKPAVNVAPLVGHHALRIFGMGIEDRPPTPAELSSMRQALADALAQGAWGMSSGLVYVPGSFANTEELVELGRELQREDALYVSHIRDESDGLVGAVDEAIEIGERLGIRTQVSHLKITARRNAGHIGPAIQHLEAARGRGLRAHGDVHPYLAGST